MNGVLFQPRAASHLPPSGAANATSRRFVINDRPVTNGTISNSAPPSKAARSAPIQPAARSAQF